MILLLNILTIALIFGLISLLLVMWNREEL